jgi:hypothetical protein
MHVEPLLDRCFTSKMRIFGARLNDAIAARAVAGQSDEDPNCSTDNKSLALRESQISHGARAVARDFNAGGAVDSFHCRVYFETLTTRAVVVDRISMKIR